LFGASSAEPIGSKRWRYHRREPYGPVRRAGWVHERGHWPRSSAFWAPWALV